MLTMQRVSASTAVDLRRAKARRSDPPTAGPARELERAPQLQRWRAGHCAWRPPEIYGERGLMLAVLSDAIACYQRHHAARGGHARRLFREAQSWLMSEQTDAALSFPLVCDALGIDVERLRADLRRWRSVRGVAMARLS